MIRMDQHPLEATRTPSKSCKWQAEAVVDGRAFTAQSRTGAARELARTLVAAGIADQPVELFTLGLRGKACFRSLHHMATRTLVESASSPLREAAWTVPAFHTFGQNRGVNDLPPIIPFGELPAHVGAVL